MITLIDMADEPDVYTCDGCLRSNVEPLITGTGRELLTMYRTSDGLKLCKDCLTQEEANELEAATGK